MNERSNRTRFAVHFWMLSCIKKGPFPPFGRIYRFQIRRYRFRLGHISNDLASTFSILDYNFSYLGGFEAWVLFKKIKKHTKNGWTKIKRPGSPNSPSTHNSFPIIRFGIVKIKFKKKIEEERFSHKRGNVTFSNTIAIINQNRNWFNFEQVYLLARFREFLLNKIYWRLGISFNFWLSYAKDLHLSNKKEFFISCAVFVSSNIQFISVWNCTSS